MGDRGRTRLRVSSMLAISHGRVHTTWYPTYTVRRIYTIDSPVVALRYTLQLADDLQDE